MRFVLFSYILLVIKHWFKVQTVKYSNMGCQIFKGGIQNNILLGIYCILYIETRMSTMKPKLLWIQIWWYLLRQPTGQRISKVRKQQFFFNSANLILLLWGKSGIIKFELKKLRFYGVRPNRNTYLSLISAFFDNLALFSWSMLIFDQKPT